MEKTDHKRAHFQYSWEQAVEILREDPSCKDLIFNAYLTADLLDNCRRFADSDEFAEVTKLLAETESGSELLDVPAGNGIATYAFSKAGYKVTAVDPDASASVGRGAIQYVLATAALTADIVDAVGERLPFPSESFDVVYVRQGLHHAADLQGMMREFSRILRPNGILLASREHVVDDYGASLQAFLNAQIDHQLYGGENAFTLTDYLAAFDGAGFSMIRTIDPWDSIINLFPDTPAALRARLMLSKPAKLLRLFLPEAAVVALGMMYLRRRKAPGRLYSFLARKPQSR